MTKEEAIKLLSQIMDTLLVSNSWLPSTDNPIKEAFGMAIDALNTLPSTERKKGKWNARKDCEGKTRRITCNLCGWQSHSLCWYDYNYCPNCGAEMEGERYEK